MTEASPPVAELRDRAALLGEPRFWRYGIGSRMLMTAAGYKTWVSAGRSCLFHDDEAECFVVADVAGVPGLQPRSDQVAHAACLAMT